MERFLIELFLRGIVLCLLTALALVLFRRTAAAYRHLICVLALGGLLALPLAQRLLPPLRLLPPQPATTSERAATLPAEAGRLAGLNRRSERPPLQDSQEPIYGAKPTVLPPTGSGPAAHGTAALKPAPPLERHKRATAVLFAIWGIGASTLLIRLLVALKRLHRLEAESRKAMLGSVRPLLPEEENAIPAAVKARDFWEAGCWLEFGRNLDRAIVRNGLHAYANQFRRFPLPE